MSAAEAVMEARAAGIQTVEQHQARAPDASVTARAEPSGETVTAETAPASRASRKAE